LQDAFKVLSSQWQIVCHHKLMAEAHHAGHCMPAASLALKSQKVVLNKSTNHPACCTLHYMTQLACGTDTANLSQSTKGWYGSYMWSPGCRRCNKYVYPYCKRQTICLGQACINSMQARTYWRLPAMCTSLLCNNTCCTLTFQGGQQHSGGSL
jgi:hypothetical protein